ncbi:hypothetical protein [Butyrivibrio sp. VCB2006]|uniref:hypothetical protein n=1 Tax=Butyrivibrio sp. VCB2006 TaxID=1280679 RepID=UPI0012DE8F01|nr:hypothetical protein [Butyrivibrio sp. VCB2006]
MNRYRIYGLIIETEVEFMQLEKAAEEEGTLENTIYIREEKCADEVMETITKADALKQQYFVDAKSSCFFNKAGYYLIRDGKEILFETKEGYTPATVSPWLLGYCMAILLYERQTIAIHCSAVVGDDGVFIISGEMGAGKSTLTRKMLEKGFKIMADDVAAVRIEKDQDSENESAYAYPAFPYQKLCRNEVESRNFDMNELIYIDEAKDKFLVPVKDKFVSKPQKLKFMIFLVRAKTDKVLAEKLSGLNQLFAIRENVFLHRFKGSWENAKEYGELCLKLASKCPVYMIYRPAEGNSQDEIADIVEKLARGEEVELL